MNSTEKSRVKVIKEFEVSLYDQQKTKAPKPSDAPKPISDKAKSVKKNRNKMARKSRTANQRKKK